MRSALILGGKQLGVLCAAVPNDAEAALLTQTRVSGGCPTCQCTGPTFGRPLIGSALGATLPSCRILKSVVYGLVGTYTSRNSDYDGYWVFGLVLDDLQDARLDLLCTGVGPVGRRPWSFARRLAVAKFREQLMKAGLDGGCVRTAELLIHTLPGSSRGFVNGQASDGRTVLFTARVETSTGRLFERAVSVFVAPHDARVEQRSIRRLPLRAWLPGWAGT
jgi:hypothetical protein